jgi:putative ABC transport system substrate-binding protein
MSRGGALRPPSPEERLHRPVGRPRLGRHRAHPGAALTSRRAFIVGGAALLGRGHPAAAQAIRKIHRLGLLDYGTPDAARTGWWAAFHQRMRELDYVEGRNVLFAVRWADGHVEELPALAAQLVDAKVDVIVTAGATAAIAAQKATSTIPIVTATGPDPVALGLAASLSRPGGNVTGVTSISSELSGKRLELMREMMPRAPRVAILWDELNPAAKLSLRETQIKADALGVGLHPVAVRTPGDFAAAFEAMARERAPALLVLMSPMFFPQRRRIGDLALQHRLPTVVVAREYAEAGGLLAYGTHFPDLFRRAADYVDRLLTGARPGDLPIEQPIRFELVVNLRTARALGVAIPQSLLVRADEVIQ